MLGGADVVETGLPAMLALTIVPKAVRRRAGQQQKDTTSPYNCCIDVNAQSNKEVSPGLRYLPDVDT